MEGTTRSHSTSPDIPDFLIKTAMGCSLVVFLILIPFTTNNFIQDRLIIALTNFSVAVVCSFNVWLGFHNRYSLLVNTWLVIPAGIFTVAYALLQLGSSARNGGFFLAL